MLAVDTNVVVRFLVNDDARQHERAVALFRAHEVWLSKTVLLESEWVLRSAFGFEAKEIAQAFEHLLRLPSVSCENRHVLSAAIDALRHGMDFADALHLQAARHADCDEGFSTFDRKFIARVTRRWPDVRVSQPPSV
ncbi:MAG: type II toxin-antitoxin system VapC family toxin [Lautropia sp.]|nr:type II toxin-antitoxin system VapC family toxin [Lautropia sp.]